MNLIYTIWVLKLAIVLYLFLSTLIAFYLLKHSINPLFTITTIKQFIYLIYNLWNLCSSEQQVERTRATLMPLDGGREQWAAQERASVPSTGRDSQTKWGSCFIIVSTFIWPHTVRKVRCEVQWGGERNKGDIIWPLRNLDLTF